MKTASSLIVLIVTLAACFSSGECHGRHDGPHHYHGPRGPFPPAPAPAPPPPFNQPFPGPYPPRQEPFLFPPPPNPVVNSTSPTPPTSPNPPPTTSSINNQTTSQNETTIPGQTLPDSTNASSFAKFWDKVLAFFG